MKFTVYLFFALLPITAVIAHDYYVTHGQDFAFTSLGYHIYNYIPPLFYTIKETFAESSARSLVSFLMKTHMVIYCALISGPAVLYVIQCKQQNRGPFRQYLNDIPKAPKKWLNKENLASRFSGGKLHENTSQQYNSGE
jgi:hypothetical protein